MITSTARTLVRAGAAGVLLAALGLGGSALADTPSAWAESPHVSAFQFVLVLFLIPIGLFIVITALAALPSLMRSHDAGSDLVAREGGQDADEPHLDSNLH